MRGARYVVLGLAPARSAWFRAVGQWATSGSLPVEFIKCLSVDDLRARLAAGNPVSALVVDAGMPSVDRDLLGMARHAGSAALVVVDERVPRDWLALGAHGMLAPGFDRDDLLGALAAHARLITRADAGAEAAADLGPVDAVPTGWRCPLVAVTGAGGTGASTAAMALAQSLGADARYEALVLLADFRLHAELAMLHDAREVVPGVPELVESHRSGQPSFEAVRALTFAVAERGYDLLLGLRRARDWSTVRPRAFDAALDTLQDGYRMIVCDVDADFEGERWGGSIDVEERNVMARSVARRADAVLVVGSPTMKGLHGLARVTADVIELGVAASRVVPVVNRAPRSPRQRAVVSRALAELVGDDHALASPLFLPERRNLGEALHDGVRLPASIGDTLSACVGAVIERNEAPLPEATPEPVKPGSLGRWAEPEMSA